MNPCPKTKPVRLYGKEKQAFRKKVCDIAKSSCEVCGRHAPLLWGGTFDLYACGHMAHILSYGAGGGDTLENVYWKCHGCHIVKEHGARWSKQ